MRGSTGAGSGVHPLGLVDHVAVAVVERRRVAEAARLRNVARERGGLAHQLVLQPALRGDRAERERLEGAGRELRRGEGGEEERHGHLSALTGTTNYTTVV